jgi:hypothetical protein
MRYGSKHMPCQMWKGRTGYKPFVFIEEASVLKRITKLDSKAVAAFTQGGCFRPNALGESRDSRGGFSFDSPLVVFETSLRAKIVLIVTCLRNTL